MAGNSALSAAVKAKKDEFYTQLTDIERKCGTTASILRIRLYCATVMIRLNRIFSNILF